MVKDIVTIFETQYDKDKLTLTLPEALTHLFSMELQFEMIKSNSLQPIKLIYEHCIVTQQHSIAYIFVNVFDDLEEEIAKKQGEVAKTMFKDTLEFNDVQVFENLKMDEVLKKLNYIIQKAEIFELKNEN